MATRTRHPMCLRGSKLQWAQKQNKALLSRACWSTKNVSWGRIYTPGRVRTYYIYIYICIALGLASEMAQRVDHDGWGKHLPAPAELSFIEATQSPQTTPWI